jgi:hypothetical protein
MISSFPFKPLQSISSGKEIVEFFLKNEISQHPFFSKAEKYNIAYVKLILENGRDLDITGFLARTISMTNNLNVRCALVPQLFDELGKGDYDKLHILHIANLLEAITPYTNLKENKDWDILNNSYRQLADKYSKLFFSDNINTCLGVAIANEIIVQPIFEFIKENVFTNKDKFNPEDMLWVTAHDELEEDHVQDTIHLSQVINQDKVVLLEVFNAGFELLTAFWTFFDTLNSIEVIDND